MDEINDEVFEISDASMMSDVTDVSDAEDMDTSVPLLLEQVKSIVDKELVVYTTRLEQMKIPFQGHSVSLEKIEKASKPILKQTKGVTLKTDPWSVENLNEPCSRTQLERMPIPFQDRDMKDVTVKAEPMQSMEISHEPCSRTQLEQMLVPFQDRNMKYVTVKAEPLQSMEMSHVPCSLTQLEQMQLPFQDRNMKDVTVKAEPMQSMEISHEPCSRTQLELMPIPFQDRNMKDVNAKAVQMQSMEISHEPCSPTQLELMPIPFQDRNMKDVNAKAEQMQSMENLHEPRGRTCFNDKSKGKIKCTMPETPHQTFHRGLCRPVSVTLTDYRKYPVLNTKEMIRWDEYCKYQRYDRKGAKLDHVVKIVHARSDLTEIFYMSNLGVLKVERGPVGSLACKVIPNILEVNVCCWYSRNKYLRELYLQLESDNCTDNVGAKKNLPGLSRYLPHYMMLCGNHKCPPGHCKCCEYCKKHIWFQTREQPKHNLTQKVPQISKLKLSYSTKLAKNSSKCLIAKALVYSKYNQIHTKENNNQNVKKQEKLKGAAKNKLLELRYIIKNTGGTVTVNKIKILEIDHNGQIQSCIEKKVPEFSISGLVDESKKKIIHEVCCWNKLQQIIDTLKTKSFLPEVYQFIRQKHTCPIDSCHCCCFWRPSTISNVSNISNKPKPTNPTTTTPTTKSGISVKPLNLLINKPKRRRRSKKKSTFFTRKKAHVGKVNSNVSRTMVAPICPPVTAVSADQTTVGNEKNMINVKKIFVPTGNPVSGCGVNSKLMQSIIDEEITRLIESNTIIPLNVVNKQTFIESAPEIPKNITFNLKKTNQNEVPGVIEVNNYIKQILEKFQDIRFTVNKEGKVTAIISNPPETASDLTLLRNILEKIQALLDKQTEKTDETLSDILGLQESAIFSMPGTPASAPLYATNLNNMTSTISVTTLEPNSQEVAIKNCTNQLALNNTSIDAGIAQEYPNTSDETSDILVNLLTRAPIPPNFPEESGFIYLYREYENIQNDKHKLPSEDNCLDNIKIAKVESIGRKDIDTVPKNKDPESIRFRAQSQLDRLQKKTYSKRKPTVRLVPRTIPLSSLTPTPPLAVLSSLPMSSDPFTSTFPMISPGSVCLETRSKTTPVPVPPLSALSSVDPSRPTSGLISSVPVQCSSGVTSIPCPELSPSFFTPVDMPTVQLMQNIDAPTILSQTIVIPDDDDDDIIKTESILGD